MVIKRESGAGGKMSLDQSFIERILEKATNVNVNLKIDVPGSFFGPVVQVPDNGQPPVVNPDPDIVNGTLVTVQHPSKEHALISTWRSENANGFPMFTAFPTDNPVHEPLRLKILNNIQFYVEPEIVKGDSDIFAYKIIDWDGYFAGLGAVDHLDEPLDVNKLYIREDWCV